MTPSQAYNRLWGEYGTRYSLDQDVCISLLDEMQKRAMAYDSDAFLYWEEVFKPQVELSLQSGGYTPCVIGDLDLPVTDGTATGTIRRFDNTNRKFAIEMDDGSAAFADGGTVTITGGTGGGTANASSAVDVNFVGPYYLPSDPPVRKIVGVHSLTDDQLFRPPSLSAQLDYGLAIYRNDPRHWLYQARENPIPRPVDASVNSDGGKRWVKFKTSTEWKDDTVYRWCYYRRAPDFDVNNNQSLVLPEEYHSSVLLEGAKLMADGLVSGNRATDDQLNAICERMWLDLEDVYKGNGYPQNQISEGQP